MDQLLHLPRELEPIIIHLLARTALNPGGIQSWLSMANYPTAMGYDSDTTLK